MERAIVGFDQDELGDWRAILACGHRQHVRHNPPFVNRPWVLTEKGRRGFLGATLECVACDEGEPLGDGMVSAAALEAAYDRFAAELDAFVRRRVTDEGDATDILRRALVAIRDGAGSYESGPVERWLVALVRAALPEPTLAGDDASGLTTAAWAILDCLPGPHRQAIILTGYRGLSERELAARLDVPPGAAMARLSAARVMLAEALRDCCEVALDSNRF